MVRSAFGTGAELWNGVVTLGRHERWLDCRGGSGRHWLAVASVAGWWQGALKLQVVPPGLAGSAVVVRRLWVGPVSTGAIACAFMAPGLLGAPVWPG